MVNNSPHTCASAYIIGRAEAQSGFTFNGDTTNAGGNSTDKCGSTTVQANWDSGYDEFFRIWLYVGDEIDFSMAGNFSERLKVHANDSCSGAANFCGGFTTTLSYTAQVEGWHTVVVDGASLTFEDWGPYTFTLTLTPGPNDCSCINPP